MTLRRKSMIEVKGDYIIAATLDGKPLYPVSLLKGETVTITEPKDGYTEENRTRWLTQSFEMSVEAKITRGFVWRYILSFFGGCLFGIIIMALMVASRDDQMRREEGDDD